MLRRLGELFERKLQAFADHIVATRPGDRDAPNSTDTNGIRGYVIYDRKTGDPYMTRVLFPRVFGVRVMLHRIHRPDYDRDLHDHPWDWCASFILRGSYDEERLDEGCPDDAIATRFRRVKWFNWITADTWHRINQLHGNVWTLFVTGERVQAWGFRRWDGAARGFVKVPNTEYKPA